MKLFVLVLTVILTLSPPARGRGLKLLVDGRFVLGRGSPPARGRGLKLGVKHPVRVIAPSPPARGRGLKPKGLHEHDE